MRAGGSFYPGMPTKLMNKLRVVLWGCLAVWLALELGMRVVRVSHPRFWCTDPEVGHVLRAGASGWYEDEGEGYVSINEQGMRDRPRAIERPKGAMRIAVLGDSMTEADSVEFNECYAAQLQVALTSRAELVSRRVEVMNFGVSGYSTGQELLLFRHKVAAFKPDIVLVCFNAANDIRENCGELGGAQLRPYFRLDGKTLVVDERFRTALAQRGFVRPFLWLLDAVSDWSRVVQWLAWKAGRAGLPQAQPDANGVVADDRAFAPSPDDTWREAWVITERLFITLRDECTAAGARLMVVSSTYGPQVDPDPKVRDALAQRLGVGDLLYPDVRLAPFLVGNGIPYLPLATNFQRQALEKKVQFHGFEKDGTIGRGHWNKDGHALAAKLIVPWLLQHLSQ